MSKAKVAIIEDDHIISQMYRMKFESNGYEIEVASNGQAGIDLVKRFKPDIILLDLKMPGMNGDECLKEIRKADWGKNIPVIILTNISLEESPKALQGLDIANYILKAESTPKQVVAITETTIIACKDKK